MTSSRIPTEVELAFEVLPCNALRSAQEPIGAPHPCTYFRSWGTYHSYDYSIDGAPASDVVVVIMNDKSYGAEYIHLFA